MKLEKWKYKDKEIDIPIFDNEEIETNEDLEQLEKTVDLTNVIEVIEKNDAQ